MLPRDTAPTLSAEQLARIQRGVDHWEQSDAVRARLEAIFAASASIVLLMECVPETLQSWLKRRLTEGGLDAALEATILRMHDQWRGAASFINERGMLHFDLNPSNLLTDGEHVYAADFGLALCADFDLSPGERAFFETHRLYNRAYVDGALVGWLTLMKEPPVLSPALRALVDRCVPVARIFGDFLEALRKQSKTTPYPAAELEAALAVQSNFHGGEVPVRAL